MSARASQQRATLQAAYPGMAWNPKRLSRRERAVLAELDGQHGRFAGWERGEQGKGDFAEAARRGEQRVAADKLERGRRANVREAVRGSVAASEPAGPDPKRAGREQPVRAAAGADASAAGARPAPAPPPEQTRTRVEPGGQPQASVHPRVVPRAKSSGDPGEGGRPARRAAGGSAREDAPTRVHKVVVAKEGR